MESHGFDLREEFFGDIQMMKPMWWMRWGITIFLGIFIILFLIGSFVRYPDVIKCEAKVATTIPSITFQVAEDGEIQKVLVENNSHVRAMTPLVVLRNTANYNDILFLDRALNFLLKRIVWLYSFKNSVKSECNWGRPLMPTGPRLSTKYWPFTESGN